MQTAYIIDAIRAPLGRYGGILAGVRPDDLFAGVLLTRLKLFKDCFLMHRATLKGDFSQPTFKPFYSQTILLAYAKTFGQ